MSDPGKTGQPDHIDESAVGYGRFRRTTSSPDHPGDWELVESNGVFSRVFGVPEVTSSGFRLAQSGRGHDGGLISLSRLLSWLAHTEGKHRYRFRSSSGDNYQVQILSQNPTERVCLVTRLGKTGSTKPSETSSLDREKMILDLAIRFINVPPEEINLAFQDALAVIGTLTRSDRCFLDRYDFEREVTQNLYEWCRVGVPSEKERQPSVPFTCMAEMVNLHRSGKLFFVPYTDDLPPDNPLREYLAAQNIRSMISLPLMNGKECLGLVGFDSVWKPRTWSSKDVGLLRMLAGLFVNAELHRRNDEILAEERQRMNALIETLPDTTIYFKDRVGRFTRINQAQARILGVERPNQALGKKDNDFFTKEHARWAEEDEAHVMRTGHPLIGKIEKIRWADGSEHWVSTTKIPTFDRPGHVIGTMGISRDITELKLVEEALRLREAQLRAIIDNQPGPVVLKDTAGRFLVVNNAFCRNFSLSGPAEAIGKTDSDFCPPDLAEKYRSDDLQVMRSGQPLIIEEEVLDQGERKTYETFKSPVRDESGTIIGVTVFTWDITQRKRTEEELKKTELLYRGIFENAPVAIFQSTPAGKFITVNPAYARITGYGSPEEMVAEITDITSQMYHHIQVREEYQRLLAEQGMVNNFEVLLKKKDGSLFWASMDTAVRRDATGAIVTYDGFLTDVTARKQAEERIWYLSFHDQLTGLYNRAFFEEEARRLGDARDLPIAIILTDVNGLKLINDAFGHDRGDDLLTSFAQVLKQSCRREDLISRWGGDEFIILLPRSSDHIVEEVIERLRKNCREVTTGQVPLSVSVGYALKTEPSTPINQVIREAEERMYRNKLAESRSIRHAIITSLERTLRESTRETEAHARRLGQLARAIGTVLKLPENDLNDLDLLAQLHDLGKIAIPSAILDKPGPLSKQERETIQTHPEVGYRIAQSTRDLQPIAEVILAHHERWDGTGYPQRLQGENIPRLARIIAIVDAFDVMTRGRPYQKRMSKAAALREIERCSGSQFDPHLVKIFLTLPDSKGSSMG